MHTLQNITYLATNNNVTIRNEDCSIQTWWEFTKCQAWHDFKSFHPQQLNQVGTFTYGAFMCVKCKLSSLKWMVFNVQLKYAVNKLSTIFRNFMWRTLPVRLKMQRKSKQHCCTFLPHKKPTTHSAFPTHLYTIKHLSQFSAFLCKTCHIQKWSELNADATESFTVSQAHASTFCHSCNLQNYPSLLDPALIHTPLVYHIIRKTFSWTIKRGN